MKQFQKVGLAAAVATVAAGAIAQPESSVSRTESGDLAIIPYYTVKDGTNTGMHIINTTGSTQVVKVRLRRGTDSKDALDFNLVMSPQDEWTANIGPSGGSSGVVVTTNDTTCTVPVFPAGGAVMPQTYSEGATEGYVEIIAMAQTTDETQPIAVDAKHAAGVPKDCARVRQNFYRTAAKTAATTANPNGVAIPGVDPTVRGTHTSNLTSNGACSANAVSAANATADGKGGACTGIGGSNLSNFKDSDDNALKVSFMLTDPEGGLEAGDNAVMVEGFADAAMMTNQQPLSFGTDGVLVFDPLNFELPNLAYGSFASTDTKRQAAQPSHTTDGSMWTSLASALDADSVSNDWAAFSNGDASVNADWVVTLPGQYTMTNPICDTYNNYTAGSNASAVAACDRNGTSSVAAAAYSAAGGNDRNQLPLLLADNVAASALVTGSRMNLWDREELPLAGADTAQPEGDDDLGFSPGGQAGSVLPNTKVYMVNEVNVIAFGDADAPSAVDSDLKVTISPSNGDRGWGRLDIESAGAASPELWALTGTDDTSVALSEATNDGAFTAVAFAGDIPVVGFAVWQRSFAEQAGNYGRMVEHTTVASSGSNR